MWFSRALKSVYMEDCYSVQESHTWFAVGPLLKSVEFCRTMTQWCWDACGVGEDGAGAPFNSSRCRRLQILHCLRLRRLRLRRLHLHFKNMIFTQKVIAMIRKATSTCINSSGSRMLPIRRQQEESKILRSTRDTVQAHPIQSSFSDR